jgi:hypothetical protein
VLGGLAKSGDRRTRASGRIREAATPANPLTLPFSATLGEPHYRRSEQSWSEADQPAATVAISRDGDRTLSIQIDVARSHRIFVPIGAENPFDNEPMAINGDGVQLFVIAGKAAGGWLLVPRESSNAVDVRPIEGWTGNLGLSASWRPSGSGWSLSAQLVLPQDSKELSLDVIVNEIVPGRARRRGQLVLSGATGEFVYLRGDRHDRGRLLRFSLADA